MMSLGQRKEKDRGMVGVKMALGVIKWCQVVSHSINGVKDGPTSTRGGLQQL